MPKQLHEQISQSAHLLVLRKVHCSQPCPAASAAGSSRVAPELICKAAAHALTEGLQVPCPSLVIVAASADSDHSVISSVVCTFLPAGQ